MSSPRIIAIHTGRTAPLSRPGTFSAIDKLPRTGPVAVGLLGLDDDEQADRRVHGGHDKAILAYSHEHYATWRTDLGDHARLGRTGAFGENLTVTGLDEHTVCLGDRWCVGAALLEVSQGRQPCWKLAERFAIDDMVQRVQHTLRTGWYCRVLIPGPVAAGDTLVLEHRPHAVWPIHRLMQLLYSATVDTDELTVALTLPLPEGWRRTLERRLLRPLAPPGDDAERTRGHAPEPQSRP